MDVQEKVTVDRHLLAVVFDCWLDTDSYSTRAFDLSLEWW